MNTLKKCQESLQNRFDCPICLSPKLKMVSGLCQHRICDECLYHSEERRTCMTNCPLCGLTESFPLKRPIIPSQVVDLQRCLGIQDCPNKCPMAMWYWEVDDHLRICPKTCAKTKAVRQSKPCLRKRQRRVSDLGTVTVLSRGANKTKKQCPTRRGSRQSLS